MRLKLVSRFGDNKRAGTGTRFDSPVKDLAGKRGYVIYYDYGVCIIYMFSYLFLTRIERYFAIYRTPHPSSVSRFVWHNQ